jgi:hypothetical protein
MNARTTVFSLAIMKQFWRCSIYFLLFKKIHCMSSVESVTTYLLYRDMLNILYFNAKCWKAFIHSHVQHILHLVVQLTSLPQMLIVSLIQNILLSGGYLMCREEICHVWQLEDQIKLHDCIPWRMTKCWNIPNQALCGRQCHLYTWS